MTGEPTFLKVTEVAEYLRLSKGNLYLKLKRGVFPNDVVKKIGKSYRFELKRLNIWLDNNGNGSNGSQSGAGES